MNCLKGHIGINGTCEDSLDGLSYDSLEGVDFVAFEGLTTESKSTWTKVFSDLEDSAIRTVLNDARGMFSKKYSTTYPTKAGKIGTKRPITPKVLDDFGAGNIAGYLFDPINANYLKISLNSLLIHTTGAGVFTLYFGDAESGEVWDSIEVDAVEGLNIIPLNFSHVINEDCRPFLYWFTDEFNLVAQAQSFPSDTTGIESVKFITTVGDDLIIDYATTTAQKPASQLCYTIGCSGDAWICANKDRFTDALLFQFGLKLLIERTTSRRCNEFTLVPENEIETLKEYYQDQYTQAINNAFADSEIPTCEVCFRCEGAYHYTHITP